MNISRKGVAVAAIAVSILLLGSAAAGYWFARSSASDSTQMASMQPGETGRKALYWYDPMVPNQHFDKPGKSPFMDMQLVARYADEERAGQMPSIRIDPGIVQNLGVRLTTVERGALSEPIEAVGSVTFNQRNIAVIQARTGGFVSRVYARAPGDVIPRGAPLVGLLVPDWAGAQAEFLALLQSSDKALIDAARQRLALLGMSQDLIAQIESSKAPQTTITIRTPLAGVIETLDIREGMTVGAGAPIAKVDGLATVWIEAAIPEAQTGRAQIGKQVQVRLTAFPGATFSGRVIALLPEANMDTRTLRVRIELPNVGGRLRPGMFAQVQLDSGDQTPVVYVSSEAVIRTGTRSVVIVAGEGGRFIPTEVRTGGDVAGRTIILEGLTEGQKAVSSGQFLIDSEASLKGVLARLGGAGPAPSGTVAGSHP
jgi:membrane fusion protein, copper/silver efflux system